MKAFLFDGVGSVKRVYLIIYYFSGYLVRVQSAEGRIRYRLLIGKAFAKVDNHGFMSAIRVPLKEGEILPGASSL